MEKIPKTWRTLMELATAALLLGTATANVHAAVVNIDASQSTVTYSSSFPTICVPSGDCYPPPATQTFSLSGSFDVKRETVSVMTPFFDFFDQERIQFSSVVVNAGGAYALGFVFPSYPGVVEGQFFSADEDGCTLNPMYCLSQGSGGFSGYLEGNNISFSGTAYRAGSSFSDQFTFNVVAYAAEANSIPEPAGLSLLGLGALTLFARRRKGS